MSRKISGAEYPLAKIFSSEFEYIIPSYQRPYAWTVDQASELFDDLYDFYSSEPEEGYFLGSIVLIKQETHPQADVIDGQQRLTTLTILLSVLASSIEGEQRETLCKYILEPGNEFENLEPKPRLSLRERDRAFFLHNVQELRFDVLLNTDEKLLANESQLNIARNSKLFIERVANKLNNDIDEIKKFVRFLLTRCYLVAVSTPNEKSAFRVFSVMNSRGLDLQTTDIIKAKLLGKLDDNDAEEYNQRWEDMEIELGRSGFNDLFAYIRMIYSKEKAKRALLDEFNIHVLRQESSPQSFIGDVLEPHADALAIVRHCNYEATSHAESINHYLRWLNRINFSDWVPPSIAFLAQYKNDSKYVEWFFSKMERLTAYMHACAYNVNERIERYSQLLNELEAPSSIDAPLTTIKLTYQEIARFKAVLSGDIYTLTPRRRNYLILRLDSFMTDGAATYDPSILTIEHVLPQTVTLDSEWERLWPDPDMREQWVHKMANLVPLTQRRNSQASNYEFERKKTAYFGGNRGVSSYVLTTQVLREPSWSFEVLQRRQQDLLNVMYEHWSLVS